MKLSVIQAQYPPELILVLDIIFLIKLFSDSELNYSQNLGRIII
jgi:hypothetical protein